MSKIQSPTGSDNNSNIYRQIESSVRVIQHGWKDLSNTLEGYTTVILQANKSINIVDYIDSKLDLKYVPSNTGWNYKAYCPFHKCGNERTPSLFINKNDNRYFCQACGVSGGIVDYISKMFNRPKIVVAENILQCVNGNVEVEMESVDKAKRIKKIESILLKMSDIHREFILQNNDDESFEYIMKIMKGFDLVYIYNTEKVEQNIEEIFEHFKLYLQKYQS